MPPVTWPPGSTNKPRRCYSGALGSLRHDRDTGGDYRSRWKAYGPFDGPVGLGRNFDDALGNIDRQEGIDEPCSVMAVSSAAVATKGAQMKKDVLWQCPRWSWPAQGHRWSLEGH